MCRGWGEEVEQSANKVRSPMSLSSFVRVRWGVDQSEFSIRAAPVGCDYIQSFTGNWLMGLWRLSSPKICRVSQQIGDSGGRTPYVFPSEAGLRPSKLMFSLSPNTGKADSPFEGSQAGGILPYSGEAQAFCSIQAFSVGWGPRTSVLYLVYWFKC